MPNRNTLPETHPPSTHTHPARHRGPTPRDMHCSTPIDCTHVNTPLGSAGKVRDGYPQPEPEGPRHVNQPLFEIPGVHGPGEWLRGCHPGMARGDPRRRDPMSGWGLGTRVVRWGPCVWCVSSLGSWEGHPQPEGPRHVHQPFPRDPRGPRSGRVAEGVSSRYGQGLPRVPRPGVRVGAAGASG